MVYPYLEKYPSSHFKCLSKVAPGHIFDGLRIKILKVYLGFVVRWLKDTFDAKQLSRFLADELDRMARVIVTFEDHFFL